MRGSWFELGLFWRNTPEIRNYRRTDVPSNTTKNTCLQQITIEQWHLRTIDLKKPQFRR